MTEHWPPTIHRAPPRESAETLAQLMLTGDIEALTALARDTFGCADAHLSVLGRRMWCVGGAAARIASMDRARAICNRTVGAADLIEVADVLDDPELRDHPILMERNIRFYAGLPLPFDPDIAAVSDLAAAFCITDTRPRTLSSSEQEQLRQFGRLAGSFVERSMRLAVIEGPAMMQSRLLKELEQRQMQFRQAEKMAKMGHWRLDLASSKVACSDGIFAIYDLPVSGDPPLETALSYYTPRSRVRLESVMAEAIEHGTPFEAELDIVTCDRVRKRVRTMGEVEYRGGKPVALIGVFRDISDRYQLERRLRRLAQTDPMTGLGNREAMRAFFANRAQDGALTLVLLDLDGFKQVNDRLGHLRGDDVIVSMAGTLRSVVRAPHFVGRFGGDEFVVMLIDAALGGARDRLLADIAEHMRCRVEDANDFMTVEASMGIHRLVPGETLEHGLASADRSLYAAKRARTLHAAGRAEPTAEPLRDIG